MSPISDFFFANPEILYQVKSSTTISQYSEPPSEVGYGPLVSTKRRSPGFVAFSDAVFGTLVATALALAQASHVRRVPINSQPISVAVFSNRALPM